LTEEKLSENSFYNVSTVPVLKKYKRYNRSDFFLNQKYAKISEYRQ